MITIMFSCAACGLEDVECQVRARESSEDVVKWMKNVVMRALYCKHLSLSLMCEATQITDLKIPLDKRDPDGWIGKQTDIVPPKGRRTRNEPQDEGSTAQGS